MEQPLRCDGQHGLPHLSGAQTRSNLAARSPGGPPLNTINGHAGHVVLGDALTGASDLILQAGSDSTSFTGKIHRRFTRKRKRYSDGHRQLRPHEHRRQLDGELIYPSTGCSNRCHNIRLYTPGDNFQQLCIVRAELPTKMSVLKILVHNACN